MEKTCDIFICYRGANVILAKNFAKFIKNQSKDGHGNFGKIWYSDFEVQGNYMDIAQLRSLIFSASYFVAFIYRSFTEGFLLPNGQINPDCVTAQEFILAETARQQGKLEFIFVNMNGEEFSQEDIARLESLFFQAGVLRDDTICFFTKQNKNNHDLRQGDDEELYRRLLGGMTIQAPQPEFPEGISAGAHRRDWAGAPDIQYFFGREKELEILRGWMIEEGCRLVSIIGMGGMGKSSLTLRLCKGLASGIGSSQGEKPIEEAYDYVLWRDLLNAPLLADILVDMIQRISDYQDNVSGVDNSQLIERLLHNCKEKRCLLILDNVESILQSGEQSVSGQYRRGYEDYELLFSAMGSVSHQSCLLLNSREKPHGIAKLEKDYAATVRTYELRSLGIHACRQLFEMVDVFEGTEEQWQQIQRMYDGNPLALKLLAVHISEVYFGNLGEFIDAKQMLFGEVNALIKWHIDRLSPKQLEVLLWMALFREPLSLAELKSGILDEQSQREVGSTLQLLMTHIPVERVIKNRKFFLQPVIIEYATGMLIDGFVQDILQSEFCYMHDYALLYSKIPESVRELQKELLVKPVNNRLLRHCRGIHQYQAMLKATLSKAREQFGQQKSYVAGNVISLLAQISPCITNFDFSALSVCGVDLQGVELHHVNFADVVVETCRFRQTFGPISSVAISKDGNYMATNEATGKLHVWRTSDNQIVHNLVGHISWIFGLSFSSNGTFLASGGEDKTVRLWNLTDNTSVILGQHRNSVWTLAFSPDDQYLASGSEDGTIMVFDVPTGQRVLEIPAYTKKVFSLSFSHHNNILMSASENGTIKFWDVNDGFRMMKEVKQNDATMRCVAYSPDDQLIASCSWDGNVNLWALDSASQPINTFSLNEPLHYLSIHPTSPLLAVSGESGTIYVLDYHSGQVAQVLNRHTGEVWKVDFSQNGRYLISGGYDGVLILWDAVNWTCELLLRGYIDWIQDVAVSPDSQTLVCTNGDLTLNVWDLDTSRLMWRFIAHSGWTFSVEYHPEGRYLVTGSDDLTIKLWDTQKWDAPPFILRGHKKWIQDIEFSPDGKYLASADDAGMLLIWDVEQKVLLHSLQGHDSGIWAVAFSADGQLLASADEQSTIVLWDWKNGKICKKLIGHKDRIHKVLFDSQGTLYSGSEDFSVMAWPPEEETGQVLYCHQCWVMAVARSKDDRYIFSGDKEGWIIRYDRHTKQTQQWKAHETGIWTIVTANDDSYIVSAGEDGLVKMWDKETLALRATLKRQKPYEGLHIAQVKGLPDAQIETLKQLGAMNG